MLARLTRTRQVVISSLVLLILGVAITYNLNNIHASGETRYVSETGNDSGDCSADVSPCKTIQYAVDQSSNDDVIIVSAGVYSEIVDINKSITLQGEQAGIDARARIGSETIVQTVGGQNFTFRVRTDNVTIDGFTFDGSTGVNSLGVNLTGPSGENVTLVNNIFRNNKVGINSVGANITGIVINNNLFDSNNLGAGSDGVFLGNTSGSNIQITDNKFKDSGTAAIVIYGEPLVPLNNVLIDNNASTNDGTFVMAYSVHNFTISNNSSKDNSGTTIFIDQGVKDLSIENNILSNSATGIKFTNTFNPTDSPISDVSIKNNNISNMSDAAMSFGPQGSIDKNIVLSDNKFSNNSEDVVNYSGVEIKFEDTKTKSSSRISRPTKPSGVKFCNAIPPASAPDLFQIDMTDTKAKLYFTPPSGFVNNYVIAYSHDPARDLFSTVFNYKDKSGVIEYEIQDLTPNMTYFFKVKGKNDCAPGYWSHKFTVKTKPGKTSNPDSYYKDGTVTNR